MFPRTQRLVATERILVSTGVGSLVPILYPALVPAHVLCHVLGKCVQNEHECCLITFFQTELSTCCVLSEYLFEPQSHVAFPLDDEEKFKQ
jgi:hypothetical protein